MHGTRDEIIGILRENYPPDEIITFSPWSKADVEYCVESRGIDAIVTDEFAAEVLRVFHDNEDADIGLNWDALDESIITVLERDHVAERFARPNPPEPEGDPDDHVFMQDDCPIAPVDMLNDEEDEIT
ncbi:MAG: hypothetical protein PVI03_07480 [Candidatus Thorarchaeota archaeon]|jgi:hypothetical protein